MRQGQSQSPPGSGRTGTLAASWILLSALAGLYPPALRAQTPVAIVTASDVEAYAEALDGLKSGLAGAAVELRIYPLDRKSGEPRVPGAFMAPPRSLIIAMGAEAAAAVAQVQTDTPVLATMVLRADTLADRTARNKPLATITLDVPVEALANRLKEIFPGKTRVGIILNPNWPGSSSATLQAQAKQNGLTAHVVACSRAEEVLAAFLSLKGQVDFVWCLPDSSLYNSVTVQALLMASLNHRLPVIGFSASFVRAGALMGIYPDFRDVGLETAEAVRTFLAGRPLHGAAAPRAFKVSLNQRVERLLGLQPSIPKEVAVFR